MSHFRTVVRGLGFCWVVLVAGTVHAQPDEPAIANTESVEFAAAEMVSAAQQFWNSLNEDQQKKCGFAFDDQDRFNWHYVPRERKGITWNDLTPEQQTRAHAFLASGLSRRGKLDVEAIMSLDEILKELEKGRGPRRDPGNYAFSLFGTPSLKSTWGWRVEGHHVSINITVVEGKLATGGPVFFGANPAEVRDGSRQGLRTLGREDDLGFELIRGMNEEQKKQAVIATTAPSEIITGNSRKADPGEPKGIALSELIPSQKKQLTELVEHYANRLRPGLAQDDLRKIAESGWDKVHFAWAGGTRSGEGHYYRIHGPTFLVEFDNTQNKANHIHTVWRDAADDFGEDILRNHYDGQSPVR